jgi:hypothetical protein
MPRRVDKNTGKGFMFKDRCGQRNGRLVFIRNLGVDKHKHHVWEARCDCGVITTTTTPNKTKSCGCLQREKAAERQRMMALPLEIKRQNRKASAAKQREKRKCSPIAVMQSRLSRLHRHALMQVRAIKTSPTFEQLGYTAKDFVIHIEKQFINGMGWHNMSEWQIDHIVPVSEAKSVDDVIALNQLSNLRPLWADENNRKKNKLMTML